MIQKDATDKENLVGRQQALLNQKLTLDSSTPIAKAKKTTLVHQHSQTTESGPSGSAAAVTELDLTSAEEPSSEKYWERLAETRRRALEDSLCENEGLHNRVRSLEDELDVTSEMLEQARSLVEVLKEMLEENETEQQQQQGVERGAAEEGGDEESNDHTPPSSTEKGDGPVEDAQDD